MMSKIICPLSLRKQCNPNEAVLENGATSENGVFFPLIIMFGKRMVENGSTLVTQSAHNVG